MVGVVMTPLKKQIKELRQVRERATQGKWNLGNRYLYPNSPYVHTTAECGMGGPTLLEVYDIRKNLPNNCCPSANRWDDLLRTIEVMGEALERLRPRYYPGDNILMDSIATEALAKAERILSGEEK
jgi:hypothetical protein